MNNSKVIINLAPLDSIEHKGEKITVGEFVSFANSEEIDEFVEHSHIEEQSYLMFPFLVGIFGGAVRLKIYKVRVRD